MIYKEFAVVASIFGLLFGIGAFIGGCIFSFENAFLVAVLSGLMAVALAFPVLIIMHKAKNLKYRGIEKELGNKIICSIPASVLTEKKNIQAKVFFTENEIVLAAFEKKKLIRDSIPFGEIAKVVTDGAVSLEIYMKNSSVFRLLSVQMGEVLPVLKKHSSNMRDN